MDHFTYQDGVLHAEELALDAIAAAVGTPFYCYSTATLERHFEVMRRALEPERALIAYAVKANPNLAVIATLARLGAGADVVSEGEMRRALAAGVPPERIVFAGVGKTPAELEAALVAGVGQFNVESAEEMAALDVIGRRLGRPAPIALRVNPDVDAGTLDKISTGKSENKFGVPIADAPALYARAAAAQGLEPIGVAVHIGSQLTELAPFEAAFSRLSTLALELAGQGIGIRRIDVGGGLGVPYRRVNRLGENPPSPSEYGALARRVVAPALRALDAELVIEPGRLIAANAGVMVARVIYRKATAERVFLICDAAMNDLLRPALYDAWHEIEPVLEPALDAPRSRVDVVGPICESTDVFAKDRPLPPLHEGDLIAFRSAGAYGAAMASEYNSRLLTPEVLVKGDAFEIVRARPTYDEMLRRDRIPDWIATDT